MNGEVKVAGTAGALQGQGLSNERRARLEQAMRRLGADDQGARALAADGVVVIDGFSLHVMAAGDGPWLACVKLPRPEGVDDAQWTESLLVANAHAMMAQDWAFGLEDDGAGVMVMPLPPGVPDERHLTAILDGTLSMCRAVVGGANALRDMRSNKE